MALLSEGFHFEYHGSLVMITPVGGIAREHAEEVYADAQWWCGSIACEHRYADLNAQLLEEDGFDVFGIGRQDAPSDAMSGGAA